MTKMLHLKYYLSNRHGFMPIKRYVPCATEILFRGHLCASIWVVCCYCLDFSGAAQGTINALGFLGIGLIGGCGLLKSYRTLTISTISNLYCQ